MICFPLDDTAYEAKDMGAYLATRTRGVFAGDSDLAVSAGGGMTVTVAPGLGWLKWSDYWGVAILQETAQTLTLDQADGVLQRIDAIVARLDKTGNVAELAVKKGSFSSAPVSPDVVRDDSFDEICLATVLVGAGVTELTAADITDQRMNEDVCGLMRDGVTGIPTSAMQAQCQAMLDRISVLLSDLTAGTATMLKAIYDKDGDGVVDDAKSGLWLYTAQLLVDGWAGDAAPYTQTAACSPADGGPALTAGTQLGGPLCRPTGVQETDEALQAALSLVNAGVTAPGDGAVTVSVWELPDADLPVYWYGRA